MGKKKDDESVMFVHSFHLERARAAVKTGDYEKTRYEYRRSVGVLRHNGLENKFTDVFAEHENFVRYDPFFNKLASVFVAGIQAHPGITNADINMRDAKKDWGKFYNLGKSIDPIDIKYFFDFAEKFGYIKSESDGVLIRYYVNKPTGDPEFS